MDWLKHHHDSFLNLHLVCFLSSANKLFLYPSDLFMCVKHSGSFWKESCAGVWLIECIWIIHWVQPVNFTWLILLNHKTFKNDLFYNKFLTHSVLLTLSRAANICHLTIVAAWISFHTTASRERSESSKRLSTTTSPIISWLVNRSKS